MDKLMTRDEVADILGCSITAVDNRRKSGELTSVKVGRLVRFRPADVHLYIERSAQKERQANCPPDDAVRFKYIPGMRVVK